jgi:hypothetical protein
MVFIAWKKSSMRNELVAKELHMDYVFIPTDRLYLSAIWKTSGYIRKNRPKVVVLQVPQGFALFILSILKKIYSFHLIVDMHWGFYKYFNRGAWLLNRPFRSYLKNADRILIHYIGQRNFFPEELKDRAIEVVDPCYIIDTTLNIEKSPLDERYMLFSSGANPDKPINEILNAFRRSEFCRNGGRLIVTGMVPEEIKDRYSSKETTFTGYLSKKDLQNYMHYSVAIISATTTDYSRPGGAWAAVTMKKPLIVNSIPPTEIFGEYATFFDLNDLETLVHAIDNFKIPSEGAYKHLKEESMRSVDVLKKHIEEVERSP